MRGKEGLFYGAIIFFWIRQEGTQNNNAKIILKLILIQIQSQNKNKCFPLFSAIFRLLMTLFTLSNLYAEDLSLHDVVIKWSKICWDENDETLLRGELSF